MFGEVPWTPFSLHQDVPEYTHFLRKWHFKSQKYSYMENYMLFRSCLWNSAKLTFIQTLLRSKNIFYFLPQQVPLCSSSHSFLFQLAMGHSAHGDYKAMPISESEKEKEKGKCANILLLFQFHLPTPFWSLSRMPFSHAWLSPGVLHKHFATTQMCLAEEYWTAILMFPSFFHFHILYIHHINNFRVPLH